MHALGVGAYWHRAVGYFGLTGTVLVIMAAAIGIILTIAMIVMCIARRKQQTLDDRRTSLDLLEEGRLTPVRSKPLPPVPEARKNGKSLGSVRAQPAMTLSPHPFQTDEAEEPDYDNDVNSAAFDNPQSPEIPIAAQVTPEPEPEQEQEPPENLEEPSPTIMANKENLNFMASRPIEEPPQESTNSSPALAISPKSPGTSSMDEFYEAQDQGEEPALTMDSPRNLRRNLGFNAASSLRDDPSADDSSGKKSGWGSRFRPKP